MPKFGRMLGVFGLGASFPLGSDHHDAPPLWRRAGRQPTGGLSTAAGVPLGVELLAGGEPMEKRRD